MAEGKRKRTLGIPIPAPFWARGKIQYMFPNRAMWVNLFPFALLSFISSHVVWYQNMELRLRQSWLAFGRGINVVIVTKQGGPPTPLQQSQTVNVKFYNGEIKAIYWHGAKPGKTELALTI